MKIKRFKLNALSAERLRQKEMCTLVGGVTICSCSCYYANSGGSSSNDNSGANYKIGNGAYSTVGCNQYVMVDGYPTLPSPQLDETVPL